VDNAAIQDPGLSIYDTSVYMALCSFASNRTGDAYPSVAKLAERAKCSERQARKSIRVLEERGYITTHKRTGGVSIYRLTRSKHLEHQEIGEPLNFDDYSPEDDPEWAAPHAGGAAQCTGGAAPHAGGGGTVCPRTILTELDIYNPVSQGEQLAPAKPKNPKPEPKPPEPDFESDVFPEETPPAMREVVRYFLLRTGRTGIGAQELSAVRELEKNHTPNRVSREIARCLERFERLGRPYKHLSLEYVYNALKHQTSRRPPGKRGVSAANARASPNMSAEERERLKRQAETAKKYNEVVSGYEPGTDGECEAGAG
jgi:hypothetical protein